MLPEEILDRIYFYLWCYRVKDINTLYHKIYYRDAYPWSQHYGAVRMHGDPQAMYNFRDSDDWSPYIWNQRYDVEKQKVIINDYSSYVTIPKNYFGTDYEFAAE